MARDYCGSYIYRNDTIERVLTENGYIQNGELFFYVRDYQGNVRLVLDHNSQPVEENSYYPYGGLMAATATEGLQPYKYGGKELDRENGLDLYDSQARWYDPMLARTTTLDPLAEKYYSISPYAWCAANPVKFVDPDGKDYSVWDVDWCSFRAIFVTADLYCVKSDQKVADGTANFWRQKSREFSYSGKPVIFFINVYVVNPEDIKKELGGSSETKIPNQSILNVAMSKNNGLGEGNVFMTVNDNFLGTENTDDGAIRTVGNTGSNFMQIEKSYANALTPFHEFGHALGLLHSEKGLMTPSNNDPKRTKDIYQEDINQIIDNAKDRKTEDGQGEGHYHYYFSPYALPF